MMLRCVLAVAVAPGFLSLSVFLEHWIRLKTTGFFTSFYWFLLFQTSNNFFDMCQCCLDAVVGHLHFNNLNRKLGANKRFSSFGLIITARRC